MTGWGELVDAASGVPLVALGLWVATRRPRFPLQTAFALYSAAFGAAFLVDNILIITQPRGLPAYALLGAMVVLFPLGAAALLGLAWHFGRAAEGPRGWPIAAAVAGLLGAAGILANRLAAPERLGWATVQVDPNAVLPFLAANLAFCLFNGSIWAALVLLVGRYPRAGGSAERRQLALMSASLVAYPAMVAGLIGTDPPGRLFPIALGLTGAIAALWLLRMTAGKDPAPARNVAWVTLGAALVGALLGVLGFFAGVFGLSRALAVAILGYAILRHQLLGLDVKVRWTISKSTVAAAFIAAFFIASEGAQILFGAGNEWVGLIAAGALVFALAPLQRAAEQLAERAVPSAEPGGAAPLARSEAAYLAALRAAARDGAITRREERYLAEAAEHLGISPKRALDIREMVEEEASA